MPKKNVTLKILGLLIFSDCLETITHFCFKKSTTPVSGMLITGLGDVFGFLKPVIFSPYLWVAFISAFSTFVIWSTILSKIDLSVAVPIASFSYILVPIVSIIFLHEEVTLLDWSGILLILAGVICITTSTGKSDPALPKRAEVKMEGRAG